MRAASLFGVLVLARIVILAGTEIPFSAWTPIAYFWQDVLVALIFAGFDFLVRRAWVGWLVYATLVVYIAVNVPITLVLSSPLTWTMLRAARGALADSITHHLTVQNLGAFALIIGSGMLFPLILARLKLRPGKMLIFPALATVAFGPLAVSKVETVGLHRNALGALWPTGLPRAAGDSMNHDWRASPFDSRPTEDLVRYRGAARGRNIILVMLESTAARYLRPYGAAEDPMPNLTELASRSILFESAYAVYPESIKGLFSTLCSRYPAFDTPAGTYAEIPCSSIAKLLADAGYRTALFHSGRFMYLGMQSVIEARGFEKLEDAGAIGGNVNSSFGIDEPSTVKRILSWIDSLPGDRPFFVTYLPVAGHHPYAAPEPGPFGGESELARYRNALHYGDAALGELLRGLRARNLEEKTLFVIFGDHGEAFGQHAGNFGHTLFIYDENIRVPYLIAAPGLIPGQIRIRRVASLIDTLPTILDLTGLPIPPPLQGSSLLDPSPRMALFFTDYSLGWLGLRDSCWKYIYETNSGRSKLYDVCKDPDETADLTGTESKRVRAYRASVEQWIAAQKTLARAGASRVRGEAGSTRY